MRCNFAESDAGTFPFKRGEVLGKTGFPAVGTATCMCNRSVELQHQGGRKKWRVMSEGRAGVQGSAGGLQGRNPTPF